VVGYYKGFQSNYYLSLAPGLVIIVASASSHSFTYFIGLSLLTFGIVAATFRTNQLVDVYWLPYEHINRYYLDCKEALIREKSGR